MTQLQKKTSQPASRRTLKAAYEITAIPVNEDGFTTDDLIACLKSILHPSHPTYDFALEVLYVAYPSSQRATGSRSHLILTLFTYGQGEYGKRLADLFKNRADALYNVLRQHRYLIQELPLDQLENLHDRVQAFPHCNIAAPARGKADAGRPLREMATELPPNTAVSLLFTRHTDDNHCRVTAWIGAQTETDVLRTKSYFPSWPFLTPKVNLSGRNFLLKRLNLAIDLNQIRQVCKTLSWEASARLLALPVGSNCGMPCSAPSSLEVNFPEGMLNSRPTEAIGIGYTEGHSFVSLTREQLSRHIAILGQTGSGKSVLLGNLIRNCKKAQLRVLTLDLAGAQDFRSVYQAIGGDIYTVHDSFSPYAVNPFDIQGFDFSQTKKVLSKIFEESLGLFQPLPMLSRQVFSRLPEQKYNVPTFLSEFMHLFKEITSYSPELKSDYQASMNVRLQSVAELFGDARQPFSSEAFFQSDHLLEIHHCTEDEKLFFLAYLLHVLLEHIQLMRNAGTPYTPLVIVIDELHTLLIPSKEPGERRTAALRLFHRLLTEGRKLGLWLVVADQKLDILNSILENVGTKIILKTDTSCSYLAQLLREPYAEGHLPILAPGEGYLRAVGMNKTCWIKVPFTLLRPVSGEAIHTYMRKKGKLMSEPTKAEEPDPKEKEANRIVQEMLSAFSHFQAEATPEKWERLEKVFQLEEYLEKMYHIADPELISAIKDRLRAKNILTRKAFPNTGSF